jgi:hypothetical protein
MSNQSFVWSDCVADFRESEILELAAARGYDVAFVRWLHGCAEIGRYYVPGTGWCVAFPVKDDNGDVFRCHCKTRHGWKYLPTDSEARDITPLIWGNPERAQRFKIHEGQWDAGSDVSVLSEMNEIDRGELCVISTRCASGVARLVDIAFPQGAVIYLFPQNDKPGRNGRTASEEWLKDCLGELGEAYVVRIPAAHKDLNDWIRAADFTTDQLEYAIDNAPLEKSRDGFPEIIRGDIMQASPAMTLPDDVIKGLLAHGEKGVLAGGSKSFKTWSLLHQALAIASGTDWWGIPTPANNALFLNLELPPEFIDNRIRTIAFAMGISIPSTFHLWNLRRERMGDPKRWTEFLDALKTRCLAIRNPFVTSDPIYKLLGGRNENSAGDVGTLLEQLDDVVDLTNGSNFFGHHFSKGSQADKEAIDRASGSGVFQRDPDSILTMTPHKKPGAFTVELVLRNHEPIDPFVIEWKSPLFERNPLLDPVELKQPKKRASKYDMHMLAHWLGGQRLKSKEFMMLVRDETGMSSTVFYELLKEAENAGLVKRWPVDKNFWIKK